MTPASPLMPRTSLDWLRATLTLAQTASLATAPNPKVGCIIVRHHDTHDEILGEGCTQQAGQAHAEVMALRDAQHHHRDVAGATAYVSLEPCSHYGRTPPCALALIDAGIKKVVIATLDPNPLVAGKGVAMLKEKGITVELCSDHTLITQALHLNRDFFKRMQTGLPWVRIKIAASMDGLTALHNGESQWITDTAAREDGHFWRAQSQAILTGIGTVLADNPQLNVRIPQEKIPAHFLHPDTLQLPQPLKVLVDSHLRISPDAKIFHSGKTLIAYAHKNTEKESHLQTLGERCELLYLPHASNHAQVDLSALLQELAQRQINSVHVEAGSTLNSALVQANCVDEFLIYLAPQFLGQGKAMMESLHIASLAQAPTFNNVETRLIGKDVRIILSQCRESH